MALCRDYIDILLSFRSLNEVCIKLMGIVGHNDEQTLNV